MVVPEPLSQQPQASLGEVAATGVARLAAGHVMEYCPNIMKVALAFPGCHTRGGVERVMFECAKFLVKRGHDVTVFANEWDRSDGHGIRYKQVPVRSHPSFLSGVSFFKNCTAALAASAFDVFNTHGCICPFGGVHWVHSLQRAWLEKSRQFRPPMSLARWRQRLNPLHPVLLRKEREHFAGRRYRKIIALTEQVRHDLNRFYGVPAEDVVVIPNGYSPIDFNPNVRSERRVGMRAKLGLAPDETVLLFVAHELERKGYQSILAAMRILGSAKLRLLVVGRNDPAVVTAMAARFGVERQVTACPPTSDVAGYHAASDIFVLPTQYEAFCLAILEALGSGLPVVTTRVPGAQDAIVDGENGCLISDPRDGEELADALRRLLDQDVREQFSQKAAASVTPYEWDSVLSRYEQVLQCARS